MATLKAIKRRIVSVQNTKKITRAMKLVSAAKLKRAQDAALGARLFSMRMNETIGRLLVDLPEDFSHELLERRPEVKRRRVIAIAGERGLCGGYNSNVDKTIAVSEFNDDVELEFVPVGRKIVSTARRLRWNTVASYEELPENAALWPIEEMVAQLTADFLAGEVDEVVVYYTKFISAVSQHVTREVMLPYTAPLPKAPESLRDVNPDDVTREDLAYFSRVKYSSNPEEILGHLVPLLVAMQLRRAGLESKASEHGARMTAMEAATSNAEELIDKLQITYNRARQSSITTELIDIVGGAEALE